MYKNKVFYSSKRSKNHVKKIKALQFEHNPNEEMRVINIYPEMKYQKVLGFGSAITDAAAVNYGKMSDSVKKEFITYCFDKKYGLGFNYCRTHINSCDFSATQYTYTEENDNNLETFSIEHDMENIVPLLQSAIDCSKGQLKLLASPWSPPAWMKTNNDMLNGGKLKEEHYETWANYFVKYVQEYKKQGIEISSVTVQNESYAVQTWESCLYTAQEQALFVRDHLYPAFKKAGLDVKIMVWDHNKEHLLDWTRDIKTVEGADECIWGMAFHWYTGEHFDALRMSHEISPDKHLLMTEFCFGGRKTMMASWEEAEKYAYDMIGNFNNYMNATIDWNIMLDETGGPFHARYGGCKAPIIYDSQNDKIMPALTYYAIAHFSKFIERGAVRLGTTKFIEGVDVAAFENPDGTIVAVILNRTKNNHQANIRLNDYTAPYDLKARSITTVVIEK